jgi:hypothetical protein
MLRSPKAPNAKARKRTPQLSFVREHPDPLQSFIEKTNLPLRL